MFDLDTISIFGFSSRIYSETVEPADDQGSRGRKETFKTDLLLKGGDVEDLDLILTSAPELPCGRHHSSDRSSSCTQSDDFGV